MARFSGEHAWLVLAAGIVGYELACDEDDLLSVVVDRWLVDYPVLTRAVIAAVALHLLNALPPGVDVLAQDFPLWRFVGDLRRRAIPASS